MNLLMLQPAAILALMTIAILALVPLRRFLAIRSKQISWDDLRYGEPEQLPASARLANRNYMNLLELPVLFYAGCLVVVAINKSDAIFLSLAWAYVALRVMHSAIHLTYNDVVHRGLAFGVSNSVLAVLWIRIATSLH